MIIFKIKNIKQPGMTNIPSRKTERKTRGISGSPQRPRDLIVSKETGRQRVLFAGLAVSFTRVWLRCKTMSPASS